MANETDDLRTQIADLQSQLAFQEDTVQRLDDALAAQQQEILLLRRQVELLKQRQDELIATRADAPAEPVSEKPPHY